MFRFMVEISKLNKSLALSSMDMCPFQALMIRNVWRTSHSQESERKNNILPSDLKEVWRLKSKSNILMLKILGHEKGQIREMGLKWKKTLILFLKTFSSHILVNNSEPFLPEKSFFSHNISIPLNSSQKLTYKEIKSMMGISSFIRVPPIFRRSWHQKNHVDDGNIKLHTGPTHLS